MKKAIFLLTFLGFLMSTSTNVLAVNKTNTAKFESLTVGEFLDMKAKDVKKLNNGKLSLKERVQFMGTKKILKRAVKKGMISEDEEVSDQEKFVFNWGAGALGFLLGLIGLLIVAIFFEKPRKNAVISSLIGMAAIIAVLIIFA